MRYAHVLCIVKGCSALLSVELCLALDETGLQSLKSALLVVGPFGCICCGSHSPQMLSSHVVQEAQPQLQSLPWLQPPFFCQVHTHDTHHCVALRLVCVNIQISRCL